MLIVITCILFLGIILICVGNLKKWDQNKIQNNSFNISLFCFFLSIFLWIFFDRSCSKYQYTSNFFLNLNETNINNYLYTILEETDIFFNFFFFEYLFYEIFYIFWNRRNFFIFYFVKYFYNSFMFTIFLHKKFY